MLLWIATALTALSALAAGAIIGAKLGYRFWLWRDFQIIPRGWDADSLRETHEAVGALTGFFAVLLLMIVCMWKRKPTGGNQIV